MRDKKSPTLRARKEETRPLTILLTEKQFLALKAKAESEDRAMSRVVLRLLLNDLMESKFISYEDAYPEVVAYKNALGMDGESND